MTEQVASGSGVEHCSLCSVDIPVDFVETITSASTAIGDEMSPDAFRAWLNDETRQSDL